MDIARTIGLAGLAAMTTLAPTPALADCPTPADMAHGVTFSRSEPVLQSHFVRRADGTVTERRETHREDGSVATSEATHLLGLVAVERVESGRPNLVTRLAEADIPARVPPSGTIALEGVIDIDGQPGLNIALEYEMPGETGTVAVGPCEYETIVVRHVATISEIDGDQPANRLFFAYRYASDLGVILETIQYQDEAFTIPGSIVAYDAASISR